MLWGEKGPLEVGRGGGPRLSCGPFSLRGLAPALGPLHSSGSGYTASGPPPESQDAYQI